MSPAGAPSGPWEARPWHVPMCGGDGAGALRGDSGRPWEILQQAGATGAPARPSPPLLPAQALPPRFGGLSPEFPLLPLILNAAGC